MLATGIDHPVPVTAHVYEVAPLTAEMLKTFPVELAHLLAGWVMTPGVGGLVVGVIFPVVWAALVPQALLAVTVTVPTLVPIVTVTLVVVLATGIDHPVPVTAHVYEVAPLTAEMLKTFPVVLAHVFTGGVMAPG